MELIYNKSPDVIIGTNTFRNVPVIIQFEDLPILEVGKFESAGFTTRFPVYHEDGTKIAVVTGPRIFLTKDGMNANLKLRHEANRTVCEFEGKEILDLQRVGAAAVRGSAQLFAPEGMLLKTDDAKSIIAMKNNESLSVGGVTMQGCVITGCRIGLRVFRNGGVAMGSG